MDIILFDDHELFAKSLGIALKNSVKSFESYTSPENIFTILADKMPDVLLLDIRMGEYNGLTIAQDVLKQYPDARIIFLSGYDLVEYHNQAIRIGAKGFIDKSVSISKLIEKITLVCAGQMIFPPYTTTTTTLTAREKEILQHITLGLKPQAIAEVLGISRRTIYNHIQMINDKLGVNSTISAIVRGIELGIVTLNED
ncbi:DNA-binding response regulator [Erysipelotrichaceae bacterium]|nr:DNA-binding response regulator [Erysipelotrichaceae bacterium]